MTVLFVLIAVNLISQTNDTIILKTGEIIPCQIHDISKSGLVTFYYINSDGDSAMAQKVTESIKEIKYGSGITTKYESGILVKQTQDSSIQSPKKQRLYNTWIRTMDNYRIKNLYIYEVKKEEISVVSKSEYEKGKPVIDSDLTSYKVDNIKGIYLRKKGDVTWGIFIGSAAGSLVGFGAGVAIVGINYTDLDALVPSSLAVIGGIIGLGFGAHIGKNETQYLIDGNQISFDKVREDLKKRSIKYYNK